MEARYVISGHAYLPRRYYDIGGKAQWFFESIVATVAAAILFFRLALWPGRGLGPGRSDRWFLIPLAVLLYLLYVANFG